MSDYFYKDTKNAVTAVEDLNLSFLSNEYRVGFEELIRESDMLADEYKEKLERIEELEGIVDSLRELIEDNEES